MSLLIFNNSASFTRPNDATPYTTGDLVANSTTAGSVTPLAVPVGGQTGFFNLRLTRVRLTKTGTSNTNANFTIHLFGTNTIVFANGDNGAFSCDHASSYLGSIAVTSMTAFTDGCTGFGALASGAEAFLKGSNGTGQSMQNIYAVLQAGAAYTPAAQEVFTLVLEELAAW